MTICQQFKDLFNKSKVNHQSHEINSNIHEWLKFTQFKTQKLCLIGLKCLCKLAIFGIKKKKKKNFLRVISSDKKTAVHFTKKYLLFNNKETLTNRIV